MSGYDYDVRLSIGEYDFPTKVYGDIALPAGMYDALKIEIGEALGHNWWCVLYPKLCFSDSVHAVVEEDQKKELEEVLTVEEYEELLKKPSGWKISFRWF